MLPKSEKLDPRVVRTRQLLQQAFAALLNEKELQDITVQDIAARAGVNRATFYAHFTDKYALLNESVRESFQETLQGYQLNESTAFTLGNLRALILAACEYLGGFMGHCFPSGPNNEQAMIVIQVQMHIHEIIYTWLSATPHAADTPPPNAAAVMTSWAIFGSVFEWSRGGKQKFSAEKLADHLLPLLTSGLGAYLVEQTSG